MVNNISNQNKISYCIFILMILSSLSFYNPMGIFSKELSKFLFYIISVIGLIYAYRRNTHIHNFPSKTYKILIIGILLSTIMPMFFQDQSYVRTFIATLPYVFSYLSFYTLMKLNIPKHKILKAIIAFSFIGMMVYLVNIISFPRILFGEQKDEFDLTRGIARLSIPSFYFILLLYFYFIHNYITYKKRKYLVLILLSFVFIVLSVTRQVIMVSLILGLFLLLKKLPLMKKLVLITICILAYVFVLPKIPIYNEMVNLSEMQMEKNKYDEEDVRLRAWRFYTYQYQTNEITAIFGNGIPVIGGSSWGNKYSKTVYIDNGGNGLYTVDVGWAGFYWQFGLLSTLCLFSILLNAIKRGFATQKDYLSYWCICIIIFSFTSAPILFYNYIICIVTVLYLVYGKECNRNYNFKLQ